MQTQTHQTETITKTTKSQNNYHQDLPEKHYSSENPNQTRSKSITKKNYETHISHIKTHQQKFAKDKQKLQRHYEDYIEQLEAENKKLALLEHELESLKNNKRQVEEQIVITQTELETFRNKDSNSYGVNQLSKQVDKLTKENLELMDIIKIKQNEILRLEENINVDNNDVNLERQRLNQRIQELKLKISQKKPEVVIKEVVKERRVELPPLEPKKVTKYVAPPVVYQECNCGCACHEEGAPKGHFQAKSYFVNQYELPKSQQISINHHSQQQGHKEHYIQSGHQIHHHEHGQEHQGHHHQQKHYQKHGQEHQGHHHQQKHHHEHGREHHNFHHQKEHQVSSNFIKPQERIIQSSNLVQQPRVSQYKEHYGEVKLSGKKVIGIYETIQKGDQVQTRHFNNEEEFKSAHQSKIQD